MYSSRDYFREATETAEQVGTEAIPQLSVKVAK
jgi:hypothetical protein